MEVLTFRVKGDWTDARTRFPLQAFFGGVGTLEIHVSHGQPSRDRVDTEVCTGYLSVNERCDNDKETFSTVEAGSESRLPHLQQSFDFLTLGLLVCFIVICIDPLRSH